MIEGLDLLESARVLLMGSALVCAGLARLVNGVAVRIGFRPFSFGRGF